MVAPDKKNVATPDKLNSAWRLLAVSPDVAYTAKWDDSKAGEGDLNSCPSMEPIEQSRQSSTVPGHIVPILENARDHLLNEYQLQELSQLLCEFQDVFAKDEFDLGNFTTN